MARLPEATEQVRLAPVRALRAVFSGIGQMLLAADRLRDEAEAGHGDQPEQAKPDQPADPYQPRSVRLIPSGESPSETYAGEATQTAAKAEPAASASTSAGKRKASTKTGKSGSAKTGSAKTGSAKTGSARTGSAKTGSAKTGSAKTGSAKTGSAETGRADKSAKAGGARRKASASQPAAKDRFRSLDSTGNVRVLSAQDLADMAEDEFDRYGVALSPTASYEPIPMADYESAPAATVDHYEPVPDLPLADYDDLSLPSLRARLRNLDVGQLVQLLSYERIHANRADIVTMFERRIAKLTDAAADA